MTSTCVYKLVEVSPCWKLNNQHILKNPAFCRLLLLSCLLSCTGKNMYMCCIYIYLGRKVVCFVLFCISTKPECFISCSWCLQKAFDKGCMGLVPWQLDSKVLWYWMISSLKTKLNHSWKLQRYWNVLLVLLTRSWWTGFNGIHLIPECGRYWFSMIYATENSNKFQKTRFWKEKSVEDVVTLGPTPH